MARVVRKVSGKAVRGQKNGLLYSKKFWISTVAGVLAIVAIVLGLVFGLGGGSSTNKVKVDDYFAMEQTGTTKDKNNNNVDFKVSFEKASYAEVMMRIDDNNTDFYKEHTFVFATDLSKFYPMDLMDGDTNLKNDVHAEIFKALCALQYEINDYNSTDEGQKTPAALYIVDTKEATGNANAGILTDADFGGAEGVSLLLSLVSHEELISTFDVLESDGSVGKTKTILCTNEAGVLDSVNASRIFIRQKFVSAK